MNSISKVTAVVLCGGLGTRLRSVTRDKPKPMVDVADRPFLEYLLDYLNDQGIIKVVLAVSYRKELIISHFDHRYLNLDITYSIESEPLGTGGAIRQAIQQHVDEDSELVLVLNGDTFIEYQLDAMLHKFKQTDADLVMAIKTLANTERYGRVAVNPDGKIVAFEEKKNGKPGQINAGVYLINTRLLEQFPKRSRFSFEKDFLENKAANHSYYTLLVGGYFIDIGVPADCSRARVDFSKKRIFCNQNSTNIDD